jgi:hypothetical protein
MGPEDPFGTDGFDMFAGVGTAMGVFIVLFFVLFVGMVVFIVVVTVRRARKFKEAGIDPLDPGADIAIRAMQRGGLVGPRPPAAGQEPPPPPSLTQRLAELDALHRAGTITAAEREAARAKLLGTL